MASLLAPSAFASVFSISVLLFNAILYTYLLNPISMDFVLTFATVFVWAFCRLAISAALCRSCSCCTLLFISWLALSSTDFPACCSSLALSRADTFSRLKSLTTLSRLYASPSLAALTLTSFPSCWV